jgi:hypothetical protein
MAVVSGDRNAEIIVENLKETQYVLSRIDPELSGKLKSRLLAASNIIADEARAYTVSLGTITDGRGGISPIADQLGEALAGITVKKGRGVGYKIQQRNKIGSIVEFAANGKTPQGKALVEMLDRKFGEPGRFMWEAADKNREVVIQAVQEAVAKTVDEANSKFGRVL